FASGFGESGFGCCEFSVFVDRASEPLGPFGPAGAAGAISFEVIVSVAPLFTLFVTGCSDLVLLSPSGGCSPGFCGTECPDWPSIELDGVAPAGRVELTGFNSLTPGRRGI